MSSNPKDNDGLNAATELSTGQENDLLGLSSNCQTSRSSFDKTYST